MNESISWIVLQTEPYEAQREIAYLAVQKRLGPERALGWLQALEIAEQDLARFPGPRRFPQDESLSRKRRAEVRRFLFRGVRTKPTSGYHVFYSVETPSLSEIADGEPARIYLLAIRSASGGETNE